MNVAMWSFTALPVGIKQDLNQLMNPNLRQGNEVIMIPLNEGTQ